jgi:hypothetical protein
MKSAFLKKFFIIILSFVLSALCMPRLSADDDTPDEGDIIDMVAGDIQTVPANNLTRVSVTNPDVADISDAQTDKVTVLAKKAGATVLFLWDADGKHKVKIRVASEDLTALKERIQKILDEANITGVTLEENLDLGKVVVSGDLSEDDKDRLGDILGPYSDNLMNVVRWICRSWRSAHPWIRIWGYCGDLLQLLLRPPGLPLRPPAVQEVPAAG